MLFDRLSILWTRHQHIYLQRHNVRLTPHNHGTGWSSLIITLFWTHCNDAWIARNQALHGHNEQTWRRARLHQTQYAHDSSLTIGFTYLLKHTFGGPKALPISKIGCERKSLPTSLTTQTTAVPVNAVSPNCSLRPLVLTRLPSNHPLIQLCLTV